MGKSGDITTYSGVQIPPRPFWTNPGRFSLAFLEDFVSLMVTDIFESRAL